MGSPNEGKCCDAVLRHLEVRQGTSRADQSFPELEGKVPPVEVECRIGQQAFALEHTQIESFPRQIEYGREFASFMTDIVSELDGHLPIPGVYHIAFPISIRVPAPQVEATKSALITWIKQKATEFHARAPERKLKNQQPFGHNEYVMEQPPGVPYEVWFKREIHWSLDERFDGKLMMVRMAPKDVEMLRRERLTTTLDKKNPKLAQCKSSGARSILVLEESDISLSNHAIVTETLAELAQSRTDMPDEIWVVQPCDAEWFTIPIYKDGKFLEETEHISHKASELADLTGSLIRN